MSQDYINELEQDAAKASGGGGIVGQCELNRGYKVFISGLGNRESFFTYTNEAGKAQAKSKAEATGGRPQDAVELVVFKSSVKGKEVTWKDDRFFTFPLWTDAFKKIVLPSIKETKPPLNQKFWAKVSFSPDPTGRTKKNQQGEDTVELVAFIAKVYASEAEATADAGQGSNGAEPHDPMVPADYDKATWLGCKAEMVKELDAITTGIAQSMQGKPGPVIKKALMDAKNAKVAQLAEAYAATVEQVNHLIDS